MPALMKWCAQVRPHEIEKKSRLSLSKRPSWRAEALWVFVVGGLGFAYTLRDSNWRSIATMASAQGDQFVMIKIEGMHCHRCEQTIKKALAANPGVHEVEVDFLSKQASVLFDSNQVKVRQLMDSVAEAGSQATVFTQ